MPAIVHGTAGNALLVGLGDQPFDQADGLYLPESEARIRNDQAGSFGKHRQVTARDQFTNSKLIHILGDAYHTV